MFEGRALAIVDALIVACALLLSSACSPSAPSAPPALCAAVPVSAASAKEILANLAKWDAAAPQARRAAAEDVARRLPGFALRRLETFSCGGQTHEVAIYAHAKTGLDFVLVPGGTFQMGDTPNQVTLTKPFLIARTHCTQASYEKIVGSNPSNFEGPTLPVESVSWDDAQSFCGKAGLELPTETQWECACRAGTTTRYFFGDAEGALGEYAWYAENAGGTTHPVGEKKPNAFGLYDMNGNAHQLCELWPGDSASRTTLYGGLRDTDRIFRGGSWDDAPDDVGSAQLGWGPRDDGSIMVGFRPAKTVPVE